MALIIYGPTNLFDLIQETLITNLFDLIQETNNRIYPKFELLLFGNKEPKHYGRIAYVNERDDEIYDYKQDVFSMIKIG